MKGFALDDSGDAVMNLDGIKMVEGIPLLLQTCRQVIGTNKGEWFLDGNEGIRFRNILTKRPNSNLVRDEVQDGLYQVDDTLSIQKFKSDLKESRALTVSFTAKNGAGIVVEEAWDYADRKGISKADV